MTARLYTFPRKADVNLPPRPTLEQMITALKISSEEHVRQYINAQADDCRYPLGMLLYDAKLEIARRGGTTALVPYRPAGQPPMGHEFPSTGRVVGLFAVKKERGELTGRG